MKKALQWLSILVVVLLPFERIPTFDIAGYTVKLSYIAALVLIGIAIIKFFTVKNTELLTGDTLLISFLAVSAIALIGTPDIQRSGVIYALWLLMGLVYAVLTRVFKGNGKLLYYAESALICVAALVCIFGMYQFIGDMLGLPLEQTGLRIQYSKVVFGFPRIQATELEPLYLANYLLLPWYLSIYRFLQKGRYQYWYAAAAVLMMLVIVAGISRGAYVALFLTVPVLLRYIWRKANWLGVDGLAVGKVLVTIIAGIVLAFTLIRTFSGESAQKAFIQHAQISDAKKEGASVDSRISTYGLALDLLKEAPLLGHGPGSVGPLTRGSDEEFATFGYGLINNQYLELLAEVGSIGTALYLLWLGYLAIFSVRTLSTLEGSSALRVLVYICAITAIFIQYNFFSTLYIIHIWVALAMLVAAVYNARSYES